MVRYLRSHARVHARSYAPLFVWSLLVGGLAACGKEAREPTQEAGRPSSGQTVPVRAEPVPSWYEASGTLKARNTAVLSSKVVGYVGELKVQAGDRVKAGQVLAVLDAPEVEADERRARAALDEARAALIEAESGLEAAQAQARVASATYGRFEELRAKRAATNQEFDEVESRYKSAMAQQAAGEARLKRAEAGLAQAQAAAAAARAMAGYTRIKAPFDGRVVARHIDSGNLAAPGVPLLEVEEEGSVRVEAFVEESHAGRVRVGDEVRVYLEALDETVTAHVSEVFPRVDPASRAFLVKAELPEQVAAASLRPGMFARVSFKVGEAERILIPVAAVGRAGQLDRVYVAADGRMRLRLVTLGRRQGDRVEVLSGLEEGEQVVSSWPGVAE